MSSHTKEVASGQFLLFDYQPDRTPHDIPGQNPQLDWQMKKAMEEDKKLDEYLSKKERQEFENAEFSKTPSLTYEQYMDDLAHKRRRKVNSFN